jgi:probable F420-dependent oxidoreductase
MRVSVVLPVADWRRCGAAAAAAEAEGFDGVQTNEIAHEPFTPLAFAALATQRVQLVTSVAIAFPRSPMIVANHTWDLARHSGGRFALGLGTQVRAHNERRFSVPWVAPAAKMAEYADALRAIFRCWETGAKLDYQGEHYQFSLMHTDFAPGPNRLPLPPLTLAAVGPLMLRSAARHYDGVRLHGFATRAYIEQQVQPQIDKHLAEANKARQHFEVSGGGFIATAGTAEELKPAVERLRYRVAWYASTPAYRTVLEPHGLVPLGQKLSELARSGKFEGIDRLIPDEVLALFAAVGTYDQIAERIAARFGGVVDTVTLQFPEGAPPEAVRQVVREVQAIPAAFQGFATERLS